MGEKSVTVERLRIPLSGLFAGLLIVLIGISRSRWEDIAKSVTMIQFIVGIILVGVASMGRLWCSLYIAGYKKSRLITQGPYSMCRHPLYFFSFLGWVGVGLTTETFLIPLLITLGFMMYYPFVIKSEEAEMMKLHGNEFQIYLQKVPCFFPKISYFIEPDDYVVKPAVFRKHLLDALWFVWFVGIVEVLEYLHECNVIPVILKLY